MDNQQVSILFPYPGDRKYFVTESGLVLSIKRGGVKVINPYLHKGRGRKLYKRMPIAGKLLLEHRVVCSAKVGYVLRSDQQVNHINADTLDNSMSNLEAVSFEDNVAHAVRNGLYSSGDHWHNARR